MADFDVEATLDGIGTLDAAGATDRAASASFDGSGALGASMVIDRDVYRTMVLNAGPVAYWRLDTATALDSSGSGLHGVNTGTTYGPGALRNSGNQATMFNGAADINLGSPAALKRTTAFTIEMFFKSPTTNASGLYSGHPNVGTNPPPDSGGAGVLLQLDSSGRVVGKLWSGGAFKAITGTNNLADSKWHYVAFGWDGGTTLYLYIDDGPAQTVVYGGSAFVPTYTSAPFYIGRLSGGFYMLSGSAIDEVAVYPRLLSSSEMAAHSARRAYQSGWSYGRPLNLSRYQYAAASTGTVMHVIGGYNGGGRSENEAYDPTLKLWTYKANAPFSSYGSYATYMNGYIYYAGGTGGAGNWYRYNVASNTWASLQSMPSSTSEGAVVGVPALNKVYYFPNSSALGATFDASTLTWATSVFTNTLPFGRAALHSNGKIYLHNQQTLYEFDPVTLVWTQKASSPSSFQYHGWVSWLGKLWAMAGTTGGSTMNSYDPVTNTWVAEASMLSVAQYVRAGVVGGAHIMVPGGYLSGFVLTAQLYTPPAISASTALTAAARLAPYPTGAVDLTMEMDLLSDAEKINGTKGFTSGPIRTVDRDHFLPKIAGTGGGVSTVVGRLPEVRFLEGIAGGVSGATASEGFTWQKVIGSNVPLPAGDASNIYVGQGDQTVGVDSIDEYAYVTTDDGRYFYLIAGYWWHDTLNGPSWDQWWSNRNYRWDALDQTWTELEPFPGYVGSEGCCAGVIDGKIYVLMGDTGDWDGTRAQPFSVGGDVPDPEWLDDAWYLQSMWVYDIATDSWERGTQPPIAQDYGSAAVLDGKLYVVVGYDTVGRTDAVMRYDPVTDVWTVIEPMPDTPSATPPSVWAAQGKLWVLDSFGVGSPGTNKIFSYDPALDTWTDETSLFPDLPVTTPGWPYGVRFGAGATIPISATTVAIVGGSNNAVCTYLIDVATRAVTKMDVDLPANWGYFGGGMYAGTMYVVAFEPTAVYTTGVV